MFLKCPVTVACTHGDYVRFTSSFSFPDDMCYPYGDDSDEAFCPGCSEFRCSKPQYFSSYADNFKARDPFTFGLEVDGGHDQDSLKTPRPSPAGAWTAACMRRARWEYQTQPLDRRPWHPARPVGPSGRHALRTRSRSTGWPYAAVPHRPGRSIYRPFGLLLLVHLQRLKVLIEHCWITGIRFENCRKTL